MSNSEDWDNFIRSKRARCSSPNNNNNTDVVDVNALTLALPHVRRRYNGSSQRSARAKSETIPPPFPWATNQRATLHSQKYLMENKIHSITGTVECKRCKNKYEMVFDLESKLCELWIMIEKEKDTMHDAAPDVWMHPLLPICQHCGEGKVHPLLEGTKKRNINWLFLLLGQMLGCCTLKHLKYFLKHNNIHRTGAKNRTLYSTYMALYKQLVPE